MKRLNTLKNEAGNTIIQTYRQKIKCQ